MGGFALLLRAVGHGLQGVASDSGALVGAWLLGFIFVYSGAAKLRQPALAAMAIVDFGVGRTPRPILGTALGIVEFALGAGFVFSALGIVPYPWLVPVSAAVLLLVFAMLLAWNLAVGRRFPCHCFGDSNENISWFTLARTTLLAFIAAMTAILIRQSEPSASTVLGAIVATGMLASVLLVQNCQEIRGWNRLPNGG